MSEDATPRFGLPLLHAGQAQKELDHNEALALLDMAVQPVVIAIGVNIPPGDPAEGDCWVVGAAPVGVWSGQARALAGWTAGGWRFVPPYDGLAVWRISDGLIARYGDGAWSIGAVHATSVFVGGKRVLGARQPAIAAPVGGIIVDTEARATLAAVLDALRTHGLIAT